MPTEDGVETEASDSDECSEAGRRETALKGAHDPGASAFTARDPKASKAGAEVGSVGSEGRSHDESDDESDGESEGGVKEVVYRPRSSALLKARQAKEGPQARHGKPRKLKAKTKARAKAKAAKARQAEKEKPRRKGACKDEEVVGLGQGLRGLVVSKLTDSSESSDSE